MRPKKCNIIKLLSIFGVCFLSMTACSSKDTPFADVLTNDATLSEEVPPKKATPQDPFFPQETKEKLSDEQVVTDQIADVQDTDPKTAFYHEPLSEEMIAYITGVSLPADDNLRISCKDLSYVHVLHYDFDGKIAEGELICNEYIAQDLVDIFYELYCNKYPIEKMRLIDVYGGDDNASMEDNNTSCFNYRNVPNSSSLSKHSLGLAIDVNPLYNPYITYNKDGSENIAPASSFRYADRSASFPHKIDKDDLCYQLFTEHGFIWGGDWNSCKDYQHFQKALPK